MYNKTPVGQKRVVEVALGVFAEVVNVAQLWQPKKSISHDILRMQKTVAIFQDKANCSESGIKLASHHLWQSLPPVESLPPVAMPLRKTPCCLVLSL